MITKEARTRIGQKVKDRFTWTGERAVARRVNKRLAALQEAAQTQPGVYSVTKYSNGDYRVSSQVSRHTLGERTTAVTATFIDKSVVTLLNEIGSDRDIFTVSRQMRDPKPLVSIDRKRYEGDLETILWEDLSRKRRLELMREHGLLPNPANLSTVRQQKLVPQD